MKTHLHIRRRTILWTLTMLALLFSHVTAAQNTVDVTVMDNRFNPSEMTITVGDTVRWTNPNGGNPHNVTSNNNAFTASTTASSFVFSVQFDTPGEYPYRCTIHAGMTGNISVQGAAGAAELDLQSVNAVNGSYKPGDMLTINSSIMNSGDAASGAFNISYYASEDQTVTAADTLLGSAVIADVGMGVTLNHQGMVEVPASLPGGEYFIGAIIDFADGNAADNSNFDNKAITFIGLFFINAGLNDAWFNLATAGQGFFFVIFPDLELFFLSWFTFDTERPDQAITANLGEPGHRWLTAFGDWDGDTATLVIELTRGGVFDSGDPPVTQDADYGTITIVFHDCNNATLTYDIPSLGLSGMIELTRVTLDNVALCEALNAELQQQQSSP